MRENEQTVLNDAGFNPNILLLDYKGDIELINSLLFTNLSNTFLSINSKPNDSKIEVITDIYFKLRQIDAHFSIELLNTPFAGKYISWCPELLGCIAEGETKFQSLKNLVYSIAEIFVLNYDHLNINPFYENGKTPFIDNEEVFLVNVHKNFRGAMFQLHQKGFRNIFMGFENILVKKDNADKMTFSIPYNGYNNLTEHIIDNMLKGVFSDY